MPEIHKEGIKCISTKTLKSPDQSASKFSLQREQKGEFDSFIYL